MGGFSQGKVGKNLGTRQLCLGQILLWLTDSGFFFFFTIYFPAFRAAQKSVTSVTVGFHFVYHLGAYRPQMG